MTRRLLSLFSGYGGLDLACEAVLGTRTVAVCDNATGARKVLAQRFPDAPNLGDITRVDFVTDVGRVDVIAGGFPCQDVSEAGARRGLADGTRSGLWSEFFRAIVELRPSLVVIENVKGLLSAESISAVEPCPVCVGVEPVFDLRALGAVLADLAGIGWNAEWASVRASDVGAPHRRERVFIVACPADAGSKHGTEWWRSIADEADEGWALGELAGRDRTSLALLPTPTTNAEKRVSVGYRPNLLTAVSDLLPTPLTTDGGSASPADARRNAPRLRVIGSLLPTPRASEGEKGGPGQRGSSGDWTLSGIAGSWTTKARHGDSLAIEAAKLLPTPTVSDRHASGAFGYGGQTHFTLTDAAVRRSDVWGQYAPAIARWETVTGLPAPAPTEPTGRGGRERLSPRLPEWMMGLPAGWVTDVPGVTRAEALTLAGNGVVPLQATWALSGLLARLAVAS